MPIFLIIKSLGLEVSYGIYICPRGRSCFFCLRRYLIYGAFQTISGGIIGGFGVGGFFIELCIMTNNGFGGKPFKLTIIDRGYAIIGCAIIGAIVMAL
jgi:hypothetical protein